MKNRIATMLALQDAVNTQVHPQWRRQGNPWYRAIWVECAELLDHYGWKWWKGQQPDLDQVRLELVDIWHFGLSTLLERELAADDVAAEFAAALAAPVPRGDAEAFRGAVERFAARTLVAQDFDLPGFAVLMQVIELSFDELYRHYVGKNVLNGFRQDHGYRDGSYRKNWHGREDNEWLVELSAALDPESDSFAQDLYAALRSRYVVAPAAGA
ncbi:MAG: dUTP diphosphatase [Porticoccaceae bacterium]